jgi:hypothetical protein
MAAISKEQQAHLFEFSCRCLLAEQGANRPEQFSRVANQYIYNGKRKFEKDAVGMAALKVFFSRTNPTAQKFGDEWRQLVKELELKKDSKPQKRKNDGLDPQSIEFDILMHGEAVAPDKVRSTEFVALALVLLRAKCSTDGALRLNTKLQNIYEAINAIYQFDCGAHS